MSMKRLVTEPQAEINTWKRSKDAADVLSPGPGKVKAQNIADDMKNRIDSRNVGDL